MSDIIIVHQFENMIINVFGMHFDFIILHVSTIMEVPLLGLQIGPCLKWMLPQHGQLCMCRIMGPWPKILHSQNSNRVKQVAFYNKIIQLRLD